MRVGNVTYIEYSLVSIDISQRMALEGVTYTLWRAVEGECDLDSIAERSLGQLGNADVVKQRTGEDGHISRKDL